MIKRVLSFLFVSQVLLAEGQDVQYSQFEYNPLYLNPAFTGSTPAHRISLNHRIQWPHLPQAFSTYSASYDYHMVGLNSGVGVLFNTDKAGAAALRTDVVTFSYAYHAALHDNFVFKPGVSLGVANRSIDYTKLVFGDQIEFGIDGAPSQDPLSTEIMGNSYIDVGTGFIIYDRRFWLGVAAFHLNKPNASLVNYESIIPMKISFHAGGRFKIGNTTFKDIKKASIAPAVIYKKQGEQEQLDIGGTVHYSPIITGFWYRGVPWNKKGGSPVNQDALIFMIGIEYGEFEFGYSFDASISRLGPETGGAHEFSLQYVFDIKLSGRHVPHRDKVLHCPAFRH